jgi:hypothetical protein
MCKGIIAKKCKVFSSNTLPMTLTFEAEVFEPSTETETETEPETHEEEKKDVDLDQSIEIGAGSRDSNKQKGEIRTMDYTIFFKNGDDMRQDQLIFQMIAIFDSQLKKINVSFPF